MVEGKSSQAHAGFHYGYLIVAACCAGVIPVSFSVSCVGLMFSSVAQTMGVGVGLISNYITTLSLVAAVWLPFAGRLFQKVDARIMTSIGCAAIGVGLIVCSLAPNPPVFFVGGGLAGFGVATQMYLMGPVLINRWFAKRNGFFIGFVSAFMGIVTAISSPIIGNVLLASGWSVTLMGMGIVCMALSLPFTLFVVRSNPSDKGLAPFGVDEHQAIADGKPEVPGMPASQAFKTPTFILLVLFVFFMALGLYSQTMNPSYIKQLPISQDMPTLFSTAASALMVAQVVVKLAVGAVVEKQPLATGLVVLALGFVGFVLNIVGAGSSIALIGAACGIGAFTALANVFTPVVTRKFFGLKDYSAIYSVIGTVMSIGGVAMAPILGTLLDVTNFTVLETVFAVLAVISAALLVLTMASGRTLQKQSDLSANVVARSRVEHAGGA